MLWIVFIVALIWGVGLAMRDYQRHQDAARNRRIAKRLDKS
jgi:hypothetical protein